MVKRKAEAEPNASATPNRRSARNKASEPEASFEEINNDVVTAVKPKPARPTAKKPKREDDTELEVGPPNFFLYSRLGTVSSYCPSRQSDE